MRSRSRPAFDRLHGPHTLRVWRGTVIGTHGDDVFVELGPRMQGVISARNFGEPPHTGQVHEFTLCGKEESLWALSLAGSASLDSWEEMEAGSVVQARVLRSVEGGLQLKIGKLHAFMPRSQTGLPRGRKPAVLLGKNLTCEVIEIDPERQRVVVSRRAVLRREREAQGIRGLARLQAGQVVHGRVSRVEDYGLFVSFGQNHEGLVHVSNISHARVEVPSDLYSVGDLVEAKILYLRKGGKRIGLGIKQLNEDPWRSTERENFEGELVSGTVVRLAEFGAFVSLRPGVEALLPNSEAGRGRTCARDVLRVGQELPVRIVELDPREHRAVVSMVHATGSRITPDDTAELSYLEDYRRRRSPLTGTQDGGGPFGGPSGTNLGPILRSALRRGDAGDAAAGAAS